MMRSIGIWAGSASRFAAKWGRYKASRRVMDFCDLIETAVREIRIAPKRPDVVFADEAQDLNPMQLGLVRRWGDNAQYLHHRGRRRPDHLLLVRRDADAVLEPRIPEDHKIILKESHRVPAPRSRPREPVDPSSHAQAGEGLQSAARRRDVRGHLARRLQIARVLDSQTIMQHIENGQKVMLAASCSYMLHPVIAVLRQWGIAFHNPYRKSAGFLESTATWTKRIFDEPDSVPALDHPWTHSDLKVWAEWLSPKGNLRPGAES